MIAILIGDLGSGKSTLAAYLALLHKQEFPNSPQITNVMIDCATKVRDSLKFIAIKLIKKDKRYALVITDEAAQAGLESRGSGSKKQALETRVITLSRKAHVDLVLVSQLLSMIDKRAQWLGNFYVLCEAIFLSDNPTQFPDFFEYTVFDSKLNDIGSFSLSFQDCIEYIFPHMDTDDIPYFEQLKEEWETHYSITQDDFDNFDKLMRPIERLPRLPAN